MCFWKLNQFFVRQAEQTLVERSLASRIMARLLGSDIELLDKSEKALSVEWACV